MIRAVRLLIAVTILAALGYGGYLLWESPAMTLRRVEVTGNERMDGPALVRASGLRAGIHLLKLSTDDVAGRLEGIPWIARARVERILPSRVRITVVERVALVEVLAQGRSFLVDEDGVVLEESASDSLPKVFDLPEATLAPAQTISSTQWEHVIAILEELPAELRAEVVAVRAPSVDRITLDLKDGVQILYGAAESMEDKNFAVQALLERARSRTGPAIERIDVRVPARPAVKPRG